jgi:hypothetical protein
MISPTWSRFHRAVAKNRRARLWCHTPLIPAAVSIPHTVRRVGAAIRPVTRATNVGNVRAVKYDRNGSNNRDSEFGKQ